jgi:DNA (cytosine-5)-methyltransferase 1
MNVLSLFSGIGGLELGLERAGMTVVGQVEMDPYRRAVLVKHWLGVPRHDDVRTCVEWWDSEPRPTVHVVAGGPPCQTVSDIGPKTAQDDPRWLWPAMRDVAASLRPRWVIVENVKGLVRRGLHLVLADLRDLGYRPHVGSITACAVGAPQMRTRVFVLAHPEGVRCQLRQAAARRPWRPTGGGDASRTGSHWAPEPGVGRLVDGFPERVARLTALGNAVVPQVAEHVGRLIVAADRERVAS